MLSKWMMAFSGGAIAALLFLVPGTSLAQADLRQHSEAVTDAAPEENVTLWNVSAGGVLNTGNTESLQLSVGSRLELVRGSHAAQAEVSWVFGMAATADTGGDYEENANNLRARGRYDYFFTPMDAAFLATAYRRDRFAGLDARVQGQVGYLRNIFKENEGAHRFWGEIGYDLTYDNYDPDPLVDPDTMMQLDGTNVAHSVRAFLGYDNHISENLAFRTGVEGLLNVEDTGAFRLNWDSAFQTSVADNLKLELKFTLLMDLAADDRNAEEIDTTTMLNLIYTLI